MYTTLTLICLQHCLHYAPYNGAATVFDAISTIIDCFIF